MKLKEDITKILVSEDQIASRMDTLAAEIERDYSTGEMCIVGILTGSCIFLGDILRRLSLPLTVECISVSSYRGAHSSGTVTFLQNIMPNVSGKRVLLVDDILDTGRTLKAVAAKIRSLGAAEVKTCVFLRKNIPRDGIDAHYVGFDIEDAFAVGYGLDYMGYYRNFPFVGALSPEAIAKRAKREQ